MRGPVPVGLRQLAYGLYERRLAAALDPDAVPRHVGVIVDGNRRWARAAGAGSAAGHAAGADKVERLLEWCAEAGVEVVTLWLLSTENLNRSPQELRVLLGIIEDLAERIAGTGRFRLHPVGALDLLPAATAARLKELDEQTRHVSGLTVNVAIGYGGGGGGAPAGRAPLRRAPAPG